MGQMFAHAFQWVLVYIENEVTRKRREAQLHSKENIIRKKKILNKIKLYLKICKIKHLALNSLTIF